MSDRNKRIRRVVAYIPDSLFEQLELFKEEGSSILSMSDYLHDVIEEHIATRSAIRIQRQSIRRRVVNS